MGNAAEFVRSGGSLRDDDEFLRALIENTSEGLLTIDEDSVILFANPAMERILGYEPEELVGSSKMSIIPERFRSAHANGLEQYLQSGERHIDWDGVELTALHADGHEVPVSVSLREHEYDGERVFTGILTDITERKAREETLREQKAELEEFADVLSHDLRNPLAVAKAQLSLERDRRDSEYLRTVDESIDRIDQIIEDMLARARRTEDAGAVDTLLVHAVAQAAWDTVATGDATLELPDGVWQVRANRSRFRQLLENLVRNAVEHSGRPDPTVTVGVIGDGDGFYVADDGTGFSDEVIARDAGRSLDTESGHYGLHIVGTIAAEHGWSMRLEAGADGGARVEFRDVTLVEKSDAAVSS
ncbi:PAS domain-containing sensor histidine kinase [Halarchaeum sp. CBA1220]|uniref:PAS domain S-box protein n=1 Tax=Halarchaeum sp. CBA1220 TaxID=1853682 RepID=UPI000F3A90F1|nr:PAS domain-containing sensor histidine kinase [Halarchaeum sp. CBA1220]QLC33893.1 PAS domain-containing sensor histidine kinase [Halarchaeum sp. CBA1220]